MLFAHGIPADLVDTGLLAAFVNNAAVALARHAADDDTASSTIGKWVHVGLHVGCQASIGVPNAAAAEGAKLLTLLLLLL